MVPPSHSACGRQSSRARAADAAASAASPPTTSPSRRTATTHHQGGLRFQPGQVRIVTNSHPLAAVKPVQAGADVIAACLA